MPAVKIHQSTIEYKGLHIIYYVIIENTDHYTHEIICVWNV